MGRTESKVDISEIESFDWDVTKLGPGLPKPVVTKGLHWYRMNKQQESWHDRIIRMLNAMHSTVHNCTMCPLGRSMCEEHNTLFDPHVFSNMNPSKWMIVGQNPGYNECLYHEPFVGDAGKYFDNMLHRYGLKRQDFYITNTVKCHTVGNAKPDFEHIKSCESILRMELKLLKPHLVVTLGAVAFGIFCPKLQLSESFGKIHVSERFDVKVFPVYHPSPRNMNLEDRRDRFMKDIKMLCKLVRAYRKKHES